jgi:hypothetical protein
MRAGFRRRRAHVAGSVHMGGQDKRSHDEHSVRFNALIESPP